MTIPLPTSRHLAALNWRPLTPEDAPALFQLERNCALADGNTNPPNLPDCERKLQGPAGSLATDSICAADADGRLIAGAIVTFDLRLKHECRAFLEGNVHPDYRGRGLGSFILNWFESRSRRFLASVPDDRPRVLRADWYDKAEEAGALCAQHGFYLASAGEEMRRDLDEPIPDNAPSGEVSFTTWTAQNAPLFFQVYEEAFRERPGFPGWDEATWRHAFTGHDEFRADLSPLMMEGTDPVAYAVGSIDSVTNEGWINQMGVRPAWRGRGMASALLSQAMRRFKAEGLRYAALDVNDNNPGAARVYRCLGFVRTRHYTSYRKTLT